METHIHFTKEPIEIPKLGELTETGAVVEFRGVVRGVEKGETITGLYYEAHERMAEYQLRRIMAELAEASPCHCVRFIHRLGWVPVGDASLYIRVQAAHRGEAFRFCTGLIDLLKADVPIWKMKEGAQPN